MLILLTGVVLSVNAEEKQHLQKVLEHQVKQDIKNYANQHGWKHYTTTISTFIPATADHLPTCTKPLAIRRLDYHHQPIGNLKRQIVCHDPGQSWQLNAQLKVKITLPAVVAKTTINRNTQLTTEMMKMVSITIRQPKDFATTISSLVNKTAKRRILGGQVVSPSFLEHKWMIEKGDEVVVIASKNGFQASIKGIALEDGDHGSQIRIKNRSSEKIIRAIVMAKGKAKTVF